ncbi:MAG: sugar-binding protein [Candidatus Tumulicola sp.]
MKRIIIAATAALLAAGALPALAASAIDVPTASTAPSVDPRADDTAFDPSAIAQLSWNSTQTRDADESTTARVTTDGKYLYVRFDAAQKERIVSAQPVDGKSDGDLVWIDLQPSGTSGPLYRFVSSPDGSSGATASSGTAPAFQASGATYDGGYTVTMKIPLASLRGMSSAGSWNAQFARSVHASGQEYVWSHDGNVAQAGTMTMPAAVGATGGSSP